MKTILGVLAFVCVVGCGQAEEQGDSGLMPVRLEGASLDERGHMHEAMDDWNRRVGTRVYVTDAEARAVLTIGVDVPALALPVAPYPSAEPDMNRARYRFAATHAIGHLLGVEHTNDPADAMNRWHEFNGQTEAGSVLSDGDVDAYWRSR